MPPPPSRPAPSRPGTGAPGTGAAGAANKEENAYIPSFISKRPFYATEDGEEDNNDYLKHQRREEKEEKSQWYDRGRKAGPAATKYRKGACENCGAMGHKAKDCLERPRKRGAKVTGKDIQADRVIQDVKMGWDAKRDRWNGYDASEYTNVVESFNQLEELRKKAQKKDETDEDDVEGDKYAEENDMSKHQSTATRQLRIREDTAKYLVNLDLESAKYDPKTRTLVDGGATGGKAAELYAEEGFLKASGEAAEFEKAQRLAWEAQDRTGDSSTHLQANPTAGEFYRKKEREEAEKKRQEREKQLLEKYGGDGDQKSMPAALRSMAITESETFVEYDETGLVKGAPKKAAKSKYPEDIFINNHTSVWGSWWSNFKWGYACCHSTIKNSYCTGEEGKEAWEAAERQRSGVALIEEATAEDEKAAEQQVEVGEKTEQKEAEAETKKQQQTREEMDSGVTEEQMEAYRRRRTAANDPMAKFLGKDELLE